MRLATRDKQDMRLCRHITYMIRSLSALDRTQDLKNSDHIHLGYFEDIPLKHDHQ